MLTWPLEFDDFRKAVETAEELPALSTVKRVDGQTEELVWVHGNMRTATMEDVGLTVRAYSVLHGRMGLRQAGAIADLTLDELAKLTYAGKKVQTEVISYRLFLTRQIGAKVAIQQMDKIMCHLQKQADTVGYPIDQCGAYSFLNWYLTECEWESTIPDGVAFMELLKQVTDNMERGCID